MPVSEARKRANAKWDREHMTVVSVKLTKPTAQAFAEACDRLGRTRNQVLRDAIQRTISEASSQPIDD